MEYIAEVQLVDLATTAEMTEPDRPEPDRDDAFPETQVQPSPDSLEGLCSEFDAAYAGGGRPDLEQYLHRTDDARRLEFLRGLTEIDAKHRSRRGGAGFRSRL